MNSASLRVGLLLRLGGALVLLLALDAVASYFTALHFANLVYDRWLIDSTRSLAQAVRTTDGKVAFDLSAVGLEVFRFDEVDITYYRIQSARRGFIAGEEALHPQPPSPIGVIRLANDTVHGQPVRLVWIRIAPSGADDVVTVAVAETLTKRATLTREILLVMVAPQIALLGIALLLAWLGVSRGLKPLTDLAREIEARDHNNLSPVSAAGLPRETRVLAGRINELIARLGSAIGAQKRFVADAAHQLRTPLAAVLLHAERAERAADPQSERLALRALHTAVERAARLIQQLLALARTEPEAAVAAQFEIIDLASLARRVGEEWIARALEHDLDFGLVVPQWPVPIRADERLLTELLSNLIDNAFRYGRSHGRVTLMVEAGVSPKLSVEDDGPGIPAAEHHRIFERFYRLAGTSGDGCGLGLSIVQEITSLHDARVDVTAGENGQGARFTVSFREPRVGGGAQRADTAVHHEKAGSS
jgi:two-component system sensor histidine kinase TctE